VSLYKRGKYWWVKIQANGKIIRQSTECENKREAQQVHDQIKSRAKLEKGYYLDDALLLWLEAKERSDKDKSNIRIFLSQYQNRPLSQVKGHEIQDSFQNKSPSHYNRIISTVQAAINAAVARKWCSPIQIPKRTVESGRVRFLSRDEWQQLQNELPEHLLYLATFALATGLRKSNVFGLRWSSVDMARGVAWVNAVDTKAKRAISIPLSDIAINVLQKQQGNHDVYVFTYEGKPIKDYKLAWDKALKRAKIDNFRWHDLRHTWASWHVMGGTPLAVLKELGGWSSMDMVTRYAHLSPEHLKQYANNSK